MRGDIGDVDKAAQKAVQLAVKLDGIRAEVHRLMNDAHDAWESMAPELSIGETARADLSQAATLMHLAVLRLDSALHRMGAR